MGKDTDNDNINKLVRRKQGGRGKAKLTDTAKMIIILFNLPSDEFMDQKKPGFNLGLSSAGILKKLPAGFHDKKIIVRLEDGGQIIARKPSSSDRVDKYFYRTEDGKKMLDILLNIRHKKPIQEKLDKETDGLTKNNDNKS